MGWDTRLVRSTRLMTIIISMAVIKLPTKRIGLNLHRGKCNSRTIRSLVMEQKSLMNSVTEIIL